jgi:hypothetical protein
MSKNPNEPQEIVKPLSSRPASSSSVPELPNPQTRRRSELAKLLWGDPESGSPAARTPTPPAVPSTGKMPAPASGKALPVQGRALSNLNPTRKLEAADPIVGRNRRHLRRSCSLPGVLRVVIPEKSFMPQNFVVRAIDISPSGAKLETRQLTNDLATAINKERRFARLELVTPARNRLEIPGHIVRASYNTDGLSEFGVEFDGEVADIDQLFTMSAAADSTHVPASEEVISPGLDEYPSTTHLNAFKFSGKAADAEEVVVHYRSRSTKVAVTNGRFEVEVPLVKNASNFLSFVAVRGQQQSIPTPVCILHRSDAASLRTMEFRSLVDEFEVSEDGKSLMLRLSGPPARFLQALRRIERAIQHADHVDLTLEMKGEANLAADELRVLSKE